MNLEELMDKFNAVSGALRPHLDLGPKRMLDPKENSYPLKEKDWWKDSIKYSNANGLYFYTKTANHDGLHKVLYIGRSAQSGGAGIGNRACSHLGKFENREFPHHQWSNTTIVDDSNRQREMEDAKHSIRIAQFTIWSLPIEDDRIPFLEALMLTLHLKADNNLPILNKTIG